MCVAIQVCVYFVYVRRLFFLSSVSWKSVSLRKAEEMFYLWVMELLERGWQGRDSTVLSAILQQVCIDFLSKDYLNVQMILQKCCIYTFSIDSLLCTDCLGYYCVVIIAVRGCVTLGTVPHVPSSLTSGGCVLVERHPWHLLASHGKAVWMTYPPVTWSVESCFLVEMQVSSTSLFTYVLLAGYSFSCYI